ncbi:universal stress protein [Kineosporia succinea]|uniref:Nucleotide-binding universal stress UspA family protein n=1 Tax=Kineosporia succinea TaxID=84632 RepID=A0ABT9P255_9ACTN|nr:universal stress protein [Kineosporia succinea]MDP9826728.1 nucleotide-binding universal stress UspA family protein [Kineosporia succinea]
MNGEFTPRIVAGFDGRRQHTRLLDRAAQEAERRHLPLTLITDLRRRTSAERDPRGGRNDDAPGVVAAWRRLTDAVEALRLRYPLPDISGYCLDDEDIQPGAFPISAARLLVIGASGRHQTPVAEPGSVSAGLVRAAKCPVLVVPEETSPRPAGGPPFVLAAVGSHESDAQVVAAAAQEARRRGCELQVLHVEPSHGKAGWGVHEAVSSLPDVRFSIVRTTGDPGAALAELGRGAELLVVGSRPGELYRPIRESVTRGVLVQPPCPVLAVPRVLPVTSAMA